MLPTIGRYQSSATENCLCLREDGKCSRPRLDGQRFCLQHMKPDRDSDFRQCNYVSSRTGKRCFNIARQRKTDDKRAKLDDVRNKSDESNRKIDEVIDNRKEGFCLNHARLVTFFRRRTAHRNRFRNTPDSLLENVDTSLHLFESKSQFQSKTNRSTILDYFSESSDDEAQETVGDCKSVAEDSDIEIDETEDPLKHAGVYSADEIVRLTLEKMTSLRQYYLDYLNILDRKYKIKRHKYMKAVKIEGESQGALSLLVKTYKDKKKMARLQALRRYSRHFGKEALLYKQMKEKKRKFIQTKLPVAVESDKNETSCMFKTDDILCSNKPIPMSSYCLKHILNDERQVLFVKCLTEQCLNVVCRGTVPEQCRLHCHVTALDVDDTKLPFKFAIDKPTANEKNNRIKSTQQPVGQKIKVTKKVPKSVSKLNEFGIEDNSVNQKTSTPIQPANEASASKIDNNTSVGPMVAISDLSAATVAKKEQTKSTSTVKPPVSSSKRRLSSSSISLPALKSDPPAAIPAANHDTQYPSSDRSLQATGASEQQRHHSDHSFAAVPFDQNLPHLHPVFPTPSSHQWLRQERPANSFNGSPLLSARFFPPNKPTVASARPPSNSHEHSYGRF